MARAGEVVGPRLGDDADEAARRAAELGGGSLVHDDQLADGVLVERERGALSAALFPEEGIVEVGAVHDEVVEDAALPVDVQFVAVRSLGDGRPGGEERQIHEVAAVARHRIHHLFPEPLGAREIRGFDRRRQLAEDGDRFRRHDAEVEVEVEHLPHPQDRALDALRAEPAGGGDGEVVGARRQQTADELPVGRRFDGGDEIGAPVLDQDYRARDRVGQRVADFPADDARGGPRLSGDVRGVEADEGQRENDEDRGTAQAWEGPPPVLPVGAFRPASLAKGGRNAKPGPDRTTEREGALRYPHPKPLSLPPDKSAHLMILGCQRCSLSGRKPASRNARGGMQ